MHVRMLVAQPLGGCQCIRCHYDGLAALHGSHEKLMRLPVVFVEAVPYAHHLGRRTEQLSSPFIDSLDELSTQTCSLARHWCDDSLFDMPVCETSRMRKREEQRPQSFRI